MSLKHESSPEAVAAGGRPESGDMPVGDDDRVYVAEGEVVAGKYRVERVLGVGGVGFVVAAQHLRREGPVALKFLKRRFLRDRRIVERFLRETRASIGIQSDCVARVFDIGVTGGAPFLVRELLVGRDLSAVLAERGRLSVDETIEVAIHACVGLASAHAQGVVHRDVQPENLFLATDDGRPVIKLLDFGISRTALLGTAPDGNAARSPATLGTPLYLSPEQVRSTAAADARSDLWSLGVVLHELLVGVAPFQGASLPEVCAAILERDPPSLLERRPDVPAELAQAVARCLQKDPSGRYRDAAELALALLPFAPRRALAVAERSPWIRRAAIQSPGGLSTARVSRSVSGSWAVRDTGRIVRSEAPAVRSVPAPRSVSQAPGALAAKIPWRSRLPFLAAASLLVFSAVGGGAAYRAGGGAASRVRGVPSLAWGPVETPAPIEPPTAQPLPTVAEEGDPPAEIADPPRHTVSGSPHAPPRTHPLPVTAGSAARSGRGPGAKRAAPSTSSVASGAPSGSPSSSAASPWLPPPSAPGRPDLGY
jgi:serine/threonine protein kinase